MHYVYSTLTADTTYTKHRTAGLDLPQEIGRVLIRGGANVASNNGQLFTPQGFVTEVSDKELEILEGNEVFNLHKEKGFIKVETKRMDVDKAVKTDMKNKDPSAPKVPEDYDNSKIKPSTK